MRLLFFVVLLGALTGCALPVPLSERVMFVDEHRPTPPSPITRLFPADSEVRPILGGGLAVNFYPPVFSERLSEAQGIAPNEIGQNSFFQLGIPTPQVGLAFADRGAFAFSPGGGPLGISGNGTVSIVRDVYVTANATLLPAQAEVIIQRRLLHRSGSGIAAGAFYRYEYQDGALYFDAAEPVGIHIIGARTAFRFDGSFVRIQGYTSLGFALEFSVPVFGVGLAYAL